MSHPDTHSPNTASRPAKNTFGRRLFASSRVWHRRAALVASLPMLITIVTGLVLLWRGDFDVIQPKARTGSVQLSSPVVNHEAVLQTLQTLPQAEVKSWKEVSSVIFNPGKGIYQVRLKNGIEIQIDATNGAVLNSQPRMSSLLVELHEGDIFHPAARKWIFFPSGLILLSLWITGMYLFFFPKFKKGNQKAA